MRKLLVHTLFVFALCRLVNAEPKVVGVALDLSGPVAAVGNSIRNAITLAQEDFAPKGDIKFVFEDDGFQPKNTLSAIHKLKQSHNISALITFGSGTSLAAAAFTEGAQLPLVALAILDSVTKGRTYAVRHFVSTRTLSAVAVEEVKRRNYQRIAVVSLEHEAMLAQRDDIVQALTQRIVYKAEVLPSDTDFLSIVTRIRQSKADAVYLLLLPPQLSVFTKLLKAQQFQGEIFGSQPMGVSSEIKAAQGALEGAWFASADDRPAVALLDRYQQRFGKDNFAEIAHAYDAAHLLINAVKSGNIMGYLTSINDFHGALGTYKYDGAGGFTIPGIVKIIRGAQGWPQ